MDADGHLRAGGAFQQRPHAGQGPLQIDHLRVQRLAPGEAQELARQPRAAIDRAQDGGELGAFLHPVPEQMRVVADHIQHVVEIMRDAASRQCLLAQPPGAPEREQRQEEKGSRARQRDRGEDHRALPPGREHRVRRLARSDQQSADGARGGVGRIQRADLCEQAAVHRADAEGDLLLWLRQPAVELGEVPGLYCQLRESAAAPRSALAERAPARAPARGQDEAVGVADGNGADVRQPVADRSEELSHGLAPHTGASELPQHRLVGIERALGVLRHRLRDVGEPRGRPLLGVAPGDPRSCA